MTMRLFVFGAGYSGREIARRVLALRGTVAGTTRKAARAEELRADGIEPFLFDGTALSAEIADALRGTTHMVVSIAPEHGMRGPQEGAARPDEPSSGQAAASPQAVLAPIASGRSEPAAGRISDLDPVLAVACETIRHQMPGLRWIGYLSTVGVYGDHGGRWIDEDAECRPVSRRSRMRLDAEKAWLDLASDTGIPVAILRLSGIYGPGRNGFVNVDNGSARRIVKQGQVFNRIHVDDIAGAVTLLAERELGGIFNVTDDMPAPPQDVVAFAAGLMDVPPPPEIAFEDADMTPMARSFYGENKRISNARLKAEGYRFVHPDYQSAFEAMWREGNWRGRPAGTDARSKIRP